MNPVKLFPILYTENLDETIKFYTDYLKFNCDNKNDEHHWAILYNGEIEIMISKPNHHLPFSKPNFTGSFYFKIENVNQLWNKLKNKVKIVYPIESFEWNMREFAIYDNNGYILQFGEEILI